MVSTHSPWLRWSYNAGIAGFFFAGLIIAADGVTGMVSPGKSLFQNQFGFFYLAQGGMFVWIGATAVLWINAWGLVFPRPLSENQYKTLFLYYLMTFGAPLMSWYVAHKELRQNVD